MVDMGAGLDRRVPTRSLPALGGLVFVAALVASTAAAGSPPGPDAGSDAIARYFALHHGAATASAAFGVVAAMAYLCFAGSLRRELGDHPGASLIPAAAGAQIAMVGVWLSVNAALDQGAA